MRSTRPVLLGFLLAAALAPLVLARPAWADHYSDLIVSLGPAQYWRLGETSGTTASNSITSRHGTYVNTPTLNQNGPIYGITNKAVSFNGSNEYVLIANHSTLQYTSAITFMAWVKGDAWGSGDDVDVILRKGEDNPNKYQLCIADGRVSLMINDGDSGGYRGNTTLATGTWYFVAATWTGSQVRVYVNGSQDHASPYSYSSNPGTDNRPLYIGGRNAADYFDGTIDEVAIFSRALSAAEILSVYNEAQPPPTTYYVRTNGNDSNTGTGTSSTQAWATVQAAVQKSVVQPGDTICVMPGTYTGSLAPSIDGSSSKPIYLVADTTGAAFGTPGAVVLRASSGNEALDFDGVNYLTFTGFTIDGNSTANQAVELDASAGIVLERCEIKNAGQEGVDIATSSLTMINCLVHHNVYGIDVADSGCNVTLLHCTVVDNTYDGVRITAGTLSLGNSILAYNSDDGLDRDGGTVTHAYNLVFGNSGSNFENLSFSTGEIQTNPQFVDRAALNYRLQSTSPAINAGTSAAGYADVDLTGIARPVAGGYDLGCYEFPLLGQWFFEQTSGTTATDSSGNGNHGTLGGGMTFEGQSLTSCPVTGKCLDFNGSSHYIAVSNNAGLQITQSLTVMAWIRGDAWGAGSENNVIIRKGGPTPNNYAFSVADGRLSLQLDASDTAGYRGDTVLSTNTWYHVAATWDGQNVRLYLNGVQDHAAPFTHVAPLGSDTRELYLGGRAGSDLFNGLIDNIELYGYAFSASEIATAYGLVGYWKLDETSGTTAYDSGPNSLNATLYNGPAWQGSAGQFGSALQFDGNNDYLEVPAATAHRIDAYSASGWFKLDNAFTSSTVTSQILLEKYYTNDYNMLLALAGIDYSQGTVPAGAMVFKMECNAGARYQWTNRRSWQAGVWYHFAIVHDGTTGGAMMIYIDGVDDTSSSSSGQSSVIDLDYAAPLRFGGRQADTQLSGYRYLDGMLDDLRLFNRTLCGDEIAGAYASGASPAGGARVIRWQEIP